MHNAYRRGYAAACSARKLCASFVLPHRYLGDHLALCHDDAAIREHWIASTINNVTLGGILMVVSLLGILSFMGFALRDLMRESQAKQLAEQAMHEKAMPVNS